MRLRVAALVLLLHLGGCALTSSRSVLIGLEPGGHCTQKGPVVVTGPSKDAVRASMRERAASMGCNYVQLQSVREGGGGYEADGVAYACR